VEGAILSAAEAADLTVSTKLTVPFNPGEYYSTLVRRNSGWFSAVSDTRNAYIVRGSEHLPINLNPLLYDTSFHQEVLLEADDVLVIPFRQYFVTVSGAVLHPGRYPYIPDREWDYYVALAGGLVAEKNTREAVKIVDITGRKVAKGEVITPEAIITAETNRALYYINQFAPLVTTFLTTATTIITILTFLTR
jgi:hypothetical protein